MKFGGKILIHYIEDEQPECFNEAADEVRRKAAEHAALRLKGYLLQ